MLKYKVELPAYGRPGVLVMNVEKQYAIATCRTHADAANICVALNFYNDWVLVESESKKSIFAKGYDEYGCTGCRSNPCICEHLIEHDSVDCEQEKP